MSEIDRIVEPERDVESTDGSGSGGQRHRVPSRTPVGLVAANRPCSGRSRPAATVLRKVPVGLETERGATIVIGFASRSFVRARGCRRLQKAEAYVLAAVPTRRLLCRVPETSHPGRAKRRDAGEHVAVCVEGDRDHGAVALEEIVQGDPVATESGAESMRSSTMSAALRRIARSFAVVDVAALR